MLGPEIPAAKANRYNPHSSAASAIENSNDGYDNDSVDVKMSSSWRRFALQHNYDDTNVLMGSIENDENDELSVSVEGGKKQVTSQGGQDNLEDNDSLSIGDMYGDLDGDLSSIDDCGDIMNDCSEYDGGQSGEMIYDMDWIRDNAGSKVGLLEGFATGNDDREDSASIDQKLGEVDEDEGDDDNDSDDENDTESVLNAECERLRERLMMKMVSSTES